MKKKKRKLLMRWKKYRGLILESRNDNNDGA